MRYASIDIGTNTILMLLADIEDTRIKRIEDFYEVPRIGKNVSTSKVLDRDSIERAMVVLERYVRIARDHHVDRIIASATSAVREASNRDEFIIPVRDSLGIDVEVIDGPTEARITFMGAISDNQSTHIPAMVIDIGGGSTEISYGAEAPELAKSIDIGAVRITETYFRHNPPHDDELTAGSMFVDKALSALPFSQISTEKVFAVAGTATTLALIAQGRYDFDPDAVNNYEMPFDLLKTIFSRLRTMGPGDIQKLTSAAKGREDVLLAGCLILVKTLEAAGAKSFFTTDRGLRYGYLLYKHQQ